jgi:cellulose synthase/poly-beta-1,6-N-acetylglucosamine synthase-like glycosyltransferase
MEYLTNFLELINFILIIWFGYSILYMFILSITGFFYKQKIDDLHLEKEPKIALLIPAYKENEVIIDTVKNAIKHDYSNFDIIVIADSIKNETLNELAGLNTNIIKVSFEKRTKTKALNYALSVLKDNYHIAVVLDADNIMKKGALRVFAKGYLNNFKAMQGHRTAKNFNTNFAVLDTLSEEINNHLYCKGTQAIGFSSRLVGSGMAFDFMLFKNKMKEINAVGGFDKALELLLIDSKIIIYYLDEAVIYDEKVEQAKVYSSQRKRWISSQLFYLKKYFLKSIKELINGNIRYFFKASQLVFPPRLLFPFLLLLLVIINLLFSNHFFTKIWTIGFILITITYTLSIPKELWNKSLIRALFSIPFALWEVLKIMFTLKDANKSFIHTPHTFNKKNQT